MTNPRRVCVITTTRAEYGLLRFLTKELAADSHFKLQLVVSGTHLSAQHGRTITEIEADGHEISAEIEMLVSSDTATGAIKSTGLFSVGLADALARLRPDLILVLGDRYELIAAAAAAVVSRTPLVHIAGGHITEGAFDDPFRHAITKLASLHFTSNETFARRIVQMGEDPSCVHAVGSTGVDAVKKLPLMDRLELERKLGCAFASRNWLITIHPETATNIPVAPALMTALERRDASERFFFTMPNADPGNMEVRQAIERFVVTNPGRAQAYESLGQRGYLSLMNVVDGVVGNSSSGLIEAPAMNRATINIGDRQKGRPRARSVIDCPADAAAISKAMDLSISPSFRERVDNPESPFGDGHASERICKVLREVEFGTLLPKIFRDDAPAL